MNSCSDGGTRIAPISKIDVAAINGKLRVDAAAGATARFEDGDVGPHLQELVGLEQTGGAGSNDRNVLLGQVPAAEPAVRAQVPGMVVENVDKGNPIAHLERPTWSLGAARCWRMRWRTGL